MFRGFAVAFHRNSPAMRATALVALIVVCLPWCAWASAEAEYEKAVKQHGATDVVSKGQFEQARRASPQGALQLYGVIQGLVTNGDTQTVILRLVDDPTVTISVSEDHRELQFRARVRCLVKPVGPSVGARLDLVDVVWDKTPIDLLKDTARAALKIPPTDPAEIARSAAALRQTAPMPSRGGDPSLICKRAIAYLNPKLTAQEVTVITDSIIRYSTQYGVDPYLVVAVIAAESRFNPNARSYKGAMGLGQLMPATAAAHGVDAYDPVENLDCAVRILRRNLDKYNGDTLKALAAYNAGVGAVQRYDGVPPYRETRDYLWRIYEYLCWLNGKPPEPRPK